MIGGDDIVLSGASSVEDIDMILRLLRHAWPSAIFEGVFPDATDPVVLTQPFPAQAMKEVFAYRNPDSFASWKRAGRTEENAGSVVFVTIAIDEIAFVVDGQEGPTGVLVQDIITALTERRRCFHT